MKTFKSHLEEAKTPKDLKFGKHTFKYNKKDSTEDREWYDLAGKYGDRHPESPAFYITVSHDDKYAELTRKKICQEKLSDITKVVTAELKMHPINGQNYMWYEPSFVKEIKQNIDLLIIDGPPRIINKNARFPAIPLLKEYFTDDTVILLDDGRRKDEQNTVKLWLKELDKFNVDYFNTEKGTFKLSKIEEYGFNI